MYDTLSMGPSGTLKARKERKVSLLLRRTSDALVSHFDPLTQSPCCLDQGYTADKSVSTSSMKLASPRQCPSVAALPQSACKS